MSIFTGSAVAIVTPFNSGGGVNFECFAELIEFQIKEGTDAIVVCGTTGEPSTMSADEKHEVIKFCIEKVNGRVPVIAGTGGNSTANAIADSLKAQKEGASALLIVTPYYNKCTQGGLIAHYNAIADAVDIPIIVYNVPSRTGVNVLPATMQEISKHPNIAAIKEASSDISQICETARLCPNIDLYSGNDDQVTPLLSLGAKGVISVMANVVPKDSHDLVASFFNGDVAKSRELQFKLKPLVNSLFCEVNPIPTKAALQIMGYNVGEPRLPLTPMTAANRSKLENELKTLALI